MNDQPMLPDMPADPELEDHVPNVAHIFVREVTEDNIPLIAQESGKTELELTAMLMARREMQGEGAILRVRYLALNYHNHKPVQHRDGKPRWCDECGLTGDGLVPKTKKELAAEKAAHDELVQAAKPFGKRCPDCEALVDADTEELLSIEMDKHLYLVHTRVVEVDE